MAMKEVEKRAAKQQKGTASILLIAKKTIFRLKWTWKEAKQAMIPKTMQNQVRKVGGRILRVRKFQVQRRNQAAATRRKREIQRNWIVRRMKQRQKARRRQTRRQRSLFRRRASAGMQREKREAASRRGRRGREMIQWLSWTWR